MGITLSYDYANGVKSSFTQVFFHPSGMPGGGQYFYVYGTKGAVDLNDSKFYPRPKGEPVPLVDAVKEDQWAHQVAFFESIRTGKPPVADLETGAIAALTAIIGRDAIYQKKTLDWGDLKVSI
jgi:myo-inositol 2-dehydrogenase / D-chiro-inositol 1-dehydrogenase